MTQDLEEAHYYHTIQYFNALIKKHGAKQVMDDLCMLDLLTYEALMLELSERSRKKVVRQAAIFGNLNASKD